MISRSSTRDSGSLISRGILPTGMKNNTNRMKPDPSNIPRTRDLPRDGKLREAVSKAETSAVSHNPFRAAFRSPSCKEVATNVAPDPKVTAVMSRSMIVVKDSIVM